MPSAAAIRRRSNGFAGSGPQPLSLLTVQAMADMGYVVNTGAAEPWGQFLTTSATPALDRIFDAGDAIPIRERILEPEGVVDATGRFVYFGLEKKL